MPCLLTKVQNRDKEFTGVSGKLTLNLTDVAGTTQFVTAQTTVEDRTNPAARVAVQCDKTLTSLSFALDRQRVYAIKPTFAQLTEPFNSSAELKESCGNLVDTITVIDLVPEYIVEVA